MRPQGYNRSVGSETSRVAWLLMEDVAFLHELCETSGICEGDGTDKANSGYFAPHRDTLKRGPLCSGRDKPLATAAPIEGVKGGGGGWTSVRVSGEQGRSSSVLPAPGAPSHISPGIYEPRYDREIARMAE
ncbi:hypothetical protein DMN91_010292 [Ooceraea biroi]|uniref:Uncharacterized protein n=1 Tax=Ooceraea biroi TaxID=2015173 RepID=A0A3L8DC06_OOCBI|nr:hypothetical protein DMN91_010292 [Ooceraea biroi]